MVINRLYYYGCNSTTVRLYGCNKLGWIEFLGCQVESGNILYGTSKIIKLKKWMKVVVNLKNIYHVCLNGVFCMGSFFRGENEFKIGSFSLHFFHICGIGGIQSAPGAWI